MPTKIDWCDETVNPLGHGCYGPGGTAENPKRCSYCYAYKLARRNLRGCDLCKQFIPHTHFEQLDKLQKWKTPKNIFIQSMGDLFHDAIPDEWIQEVFEAFEEAPWHNYLFLTKNPDRYCNPWFGTFLHNRSQELLNNIWLGATATNGAEFDHANECFGKMYGDCAMFISVEPLLGKVTIPDHWVNRFFDWVIIGEQTNPIVEPDSEWTARIMDDCRNYKIPVFLKKPLADKYYPLQQYPEGLKLDKI